MSRTLTKGSIVSTKSLSARSFNSGVKNLVGASRKGGTRPVRSVHCLRDRENGVKRLTIRVALVAGLILAMAGVLAPAAGATQATSVSQSVTFNVFDVGGTQIATITTNEERSGAVATGTWSSDTGAAGTLWAYHFNLGLFAQIQQTQPIGGSAIVTLLGSNGSLWYRMATGDRGVVLFTATSSETNVWNVYLRGPVPPIFLTG